MAVSRLLAPFQRRKPATEPILIRTSRGRRSVYGTLGNFEGNLGTTDGGCVDNPFRWCDNLSNNDPNVFTFMSKGFANMVFNMAFHPFDSGSGQPVAPANAQTLAAHASTDNQSSAS